MPKKVYSMRIEAATIQIIKKVAEKEGRTISAVIDQMAADYHARTHGHRKGPSIVEAGRAMQVIADFIMDR